MANRNKAIHEGSCQCCGRVQKLPGELLSKHGYEVARFGYFVGVCRGAGYKPFEVSCDQVERYIGEAIDVVWNFNESLQELTKPSTKGWYHLYKKSTSRFGRSSYQWTLVEVKAKEHDGGGYTYKTPEGKDVVVAPSKWNSYYFEYEEDGKMHTHEVGSYGGYKSVQECVAHMNEEYIKHDVLPRRARVIGYVKWQTERVKTWKPKKLKLRSDLKS